MNPTVITTGPGVIIATATASRNCCSLSQPYSFTTPPYKKGTMASPLPKTKAPAFVKNQAISQSLDSVITGCNCVNRTGNIPFALVPNHFGGAFTNHTTMPARRMIQSTSSSVIKVVMANTINIIHSNLSLPMLLVVSL